MIDYMGKNGYFIDKQAGLMCKNVDLIDNSLISHL